jgi:hypothetical protein
MTLEVLVDLPRALAQQEHASDEQDQVAPRDLLPRDAEQGCRQARKRGQREEEADAHEHRAQQADQAGPLLLRGRQLSGEDRDEDDVVDAEDDLERRQRRQRNPDLRVGHPVHASLLRRRAVPSRRHVPGKIEGAR